MARIHSIIDEMESSLGELREQLQGLTQMFAGSSAKRPGRPATTRKAGTRKRRVKRATARKTAVAAPKKHRRRVSPEVHRARQLQGKYLAALRVLSKANRVKVKKIRAAKGVAASLAEAKTLRK